MPIDGSAKNCCQYCNLLVIGIMLHNISFFSLKFSLKTEFDCINFASYELINYIL